MNTLQIILSLWLLCGIIGWMAELSKLGRTDRYTFKPYINFKDIHNSFALKNNEGLPEDIAIFILTMAMFGAFLFAGPILSIFMFFFNRYMTKNKMPL